MKNRVSSVIFMFFAVLLFCSGKSFGSDGNYFIATKLTDRAFDKTHEDITKAFGEISDKEKKEITYTPNKNMHMTFVFLGKKDKKEVKKVKKALKDAVTYFNKEYMDPSKGLEPTLSFYEGRKVDFFGRNKNIIILSVKQDIGLSSLFNIIQERLVKDKLYRAQIRLFSPHVTLGRLKAKGIKSKEAKDLFEDIQKKYAIGDEDLLSLIKSPKKYRKPVQVKNIYLLRSYKDDSGVICYKNVLELDIEPLKKTKAPGQKRKVEKKRKKDDLHRKIKIELRNSFTAFMKEVKEFDLKVKKAVPSRFAIGIFERLMNDFFDEEKLLGSKFNEKIMKLPKTEETKKIKDFFESLQKEAARALMSVFEAIEEKRKFIKKVQ